MFFLMATYPSPTNLALLGALSRYGVDAVFLAPKAATTSAGVKDTVLGRLDVLPTLDGVEPGLRELGVLERRGVRVLNGRGALLATHDKLATAIRLAEARIPHPRTVHIDGLSALPSIDFPVVVKPRFGSWGRDVLRCETGAALSACLESLENREWFRKQGALVQALVPPRGFDLRLIVARGEVVGAIERQPPPGEWRTNVALGGSRQTVDPPPEACALACAATAALGIDFAGVDLHPLPGRGYCVLELNGAVEFTDEYGFGGINPFGLSVRALADEQPSVQALAVAQ